MEAIYIRGHLESKGPMTCHLMCSQVEGNMEDRPLRGNRLLEGNTGQKTCS